ncbi:recombinase family protein [Vallitalea guaymasensis]|uniref:recombinase family protein n=1 Tax=Vallitalea guaymasensis TaxID=1185412 RepID=UPI00272AEC81|nr:recombinase family protein [Vallitalea guaymasensis]
MIRRAVAYCRVSSDHEDQLNSLENQKQMWEEYINKHEGLEFCGLYVDEGISGTSTKKREAFNRMVNDASTGKFDLILTKEVSRFARNTVDTLQFTRKLKEYGVDVYFKIDNINTGDNDGELRLSLMATLAQEESRKISERVKSGHKQAMKNGIVFGANRIFGYDLIDKQLFINKTEADIVRKIFNWYLLEDESLHGIVRRLAAIGITKGKLGGKINHSSIRRILENEKYAGDLKQQKYYTVNYLTHKRKKNKGDKGYIINTDNHPAVIDRDIWNKVQMKLNDNMRKYKEQGIGYSKSLFSGKIICGSCGGKYRKRTMKNKDGTYRVIYKCNVNYSKGKKGCENGSYIREDVLINIFIDLLTRISEVKDKKIFIKNMMIALEEGLVNNSIKRLENIEKQITKIQDKKDKLLDLYMDGILGKEGYIKKNTELQEAESRFNAELQIAENRKYHLSSKKQRLDNLYNMVCKELDYSELQSNDDIKELVNIFIDKIVIKENIINFYLVDGNYEIDIKEYPKRVNTGDYPSRRFLE